jgi:hypothetical protein
LRLDANLFGFPPQKRKGRGRPPSKGKPLKKLSAVFKDRKVCWQRLRVGLWYGQTNRIVEITSGVALWYRGGVPPVPIRWLLVRDPTGEFQPQAFLATDLNARPSDILAWCDDAGDEADNDDPNNIQHDDLPVALVAHDLTDGA